MSTLSKLASKNRQNIIIPLGVATASFLVAFVAGSLVLIPSSSDAVESEVDVTVQSVLEMSMSTSNMTLDLTPTSSGQLTSGDVTANVGTNNATGYTLTMSATADKNVDLIHTNDTDKIANSTNTSAGALAVNSWGYNINSGSTPTTFLKIPSPTSAGVLNTSNAAGLNSKTTVTIAANINTSKVAGTYGSLLTFSAVGNYIPAAELKLPAGSNPSNITSTNPQVMDVYPTTGWTGDVVAITSNALFTNVSNVTIGGSACTDYDVVNTSTIACKLPPKTAGTNNDIVVTNAGSNVTDASTYTHMKVMYFDPSQSTISVNGKTYNYFASGFTAESCANMTPSNAAIGTEPENSIAYVRDTRNKQVYRVKKMVDNKCWMVDNLKYTDETIAFNNESGKANTVNGTTTQSNTNSNKAFRNNPMGVASCYNGTIDPANTTTKCGYYYNWYAATASTGTYAIAIDGTNVDGSICPANFRLPSGASDGATATGNGTLIASADTAVLNASMNSGVLTVGSSANYYTQWQSTGAWGGMLAGDWDSTSYYQGAYASWWSSTATAAATGRYTLISATAVYPAYNAGKYFGYTVRCVMEEPVEDGVVMQKVTEETCPSSRKVWAVDARDDRTYWIQKMGDGKCWMLTNLAYAGGGTNTYGDVKTITNGESVSTTYSTPYYYVPIGANPTANPSKPSESTDGGVTNPQYGYLYNWCAAMGAQTGTDACSGTDTNNADPNISVCPSGWRLPTGSASGEFQALNAVVNSASTSSPSGLLSGWLSMFSGRWYNGFTAQGGGYYWSSTQFDIETSYALVFYTSSMVAPGTNNNNKGVGQSVRCILN